MHTRVLLRAETPLTFRDGRDAARASTLNYVPGSTLLGGLAESYLRDHRNKTQFDDWFLRGKIRFANLYPAGFALDALQDEDAIPVLPLPLTARSCKRFSGFHFGSKAESEQRHGVTDALIPLSLFMLSGEHSIDILESFSDCPTCQEPLDRFSGFFRRGQNLAEIGVAAKSQALRTRTGINYASGATMQSILYSRAVLPKGANFWGEWYIADAVASDFQTFVERVVDAGLVRVGNNRTRGLGRVTMNLSESEAEDIAALQGRVQMFNQALHADADKFGISTPAALYVPLTLTSDAILYDRLLRPRLQITNDYLSDVWGLTGAQVVYQVAGVRRVESWNTVWGLPKADELAIAMGSVFLIALPTNDADIFKRLCNLQEQGIGARRVEGFGAVRVADAFHIEHLQASGGYR